MNNSEVAHAWANQTRERANGSSFYFDGKEIYSYGSHFLAGEYLAQDVYWINDKSYSNSTSKHQERIRAAIPGYSKVYKYTRSDFDYVKLEFDNLKKHFERARHSWVYYGQIKSILADYSEFNSFVNDNKDGYFRFYSYITNGSKKDRENLIARMKYFVNKHADKVSQREEKKQAIEDKKQEKRKREAEIRLKNAAEKLELWRAGEYHGRLCGLDYHYLRISKDGQKVQTSGGASVSVNSAALLYKMIKAGKDIKGHNIDGYTVISINGSLKIGCHNIDINDVHKVGQELLNMEL